MKVKLKHCTPMYIAVEAALTCTGNENKALEYKNNPEKFLIKLEEANAKAEVIA